MEKTGEPSGRTLLTQRTGIDTNTPCVSSDLRVVSLNISCTFVSAEGRMVIEVVTSSSGEDHDEECPAPILP